MLNQNQIKPCPECGGQREVASDKDLYLKYPVENSLNVLAFRGYALVCKACGLVSFFRIKGD